MSSFSDTEAGVNFHDRMHLKERLQRCVQEIDELEFYTEDRREQAILEIEGILSSAAEQFPDGIDDRYLSTDNDNPEGQL